MADRRRLAMVAVLGALFVPGGACPASAPGALSPRSGPEAQSVSVSAGGHILLVDVRSPRGIGKGSVAVPGGGWPPRVLLRLHTRGLESLELGCGETRLRVEVSSHGAHPVRSYRLVEGRYQVVPAGAPLHVAVAAGGTEGGLTVPLHGGYFQVDVPPALLAGACSSLEMRWIDFFR